jgi:hypothetical protein
LNFSEKKEKIDSKDIFLEEKTYVSFHNYRGYSERNVMDKKIMIFGIVLTFVIAAVTGVLARGSGRLNQ